MGPASNGVDPRPTLIDSSFCRLYTGPPKPPVFGDLAGFRFGARRSRTVSASRHPMDAVAAQVVSRRCESPPQQQSFTDTHCCAAESLRGLMALFPLAETMTCR